MPKILLTEAQTRLLIDQQLQAAGWQADSQNRRYSKGTRPEKGLNKAIAEWPTASGPADYALFVGMQLVGVVEAKKRERDVVSDLGQAKRYSTDIKPVEDERFAGGPWGDYKVPFLFSSNSKPYLKQIEHKSGVWFLDARRTVNHPRPLHAWFTPEELLELLKLDQDSASEKLKEESFDYLDLRDYQNRAIQKVEEALAQEQRNMLLAMATGTGKTRVAIGLVYRLIKSNRFRRILFLVDRTSLGVQAGDKFKETRLEDLLTFNQIFDLKEVDEPTPEETTRVHISTVQGVMQRIMFNANAAAIPGVGQYDCIVVDEAHRGYTLDRELGEIEFEFRDEKDYISKYRRVLEYFDAVKIGLTATPAPHTVEIFGKPVFTYSYREAVIDGWLVDHEPPHQLTTVLKKKGIRWKKGETIPVYDPATGEISNLENIPDDLTLEIDRFNKAVLTENFNRTVAKELVKELDPNGDEKTLIFAASDDHADLVVTILKEEFAELLGELDDDAITKITGSIDKPGTMIKRYRNEKFPNIAVTVDLLSTGIDVLEICNLVFLRRVKSRILYEQMLGRATRLCPRIGKDHFNIYDAVGLYEALEPVTNMKAVAPGPAVTLQMLVDELFSMDSDADQKRHVEQMVAKLQRKVQGMSEEVREAFEILSGGETLKDFIASLREKGVDAAKEFIQTKRHLFTFLDENRYQPQKQFISTHADELESHTRGYGKGEKPEDYLNEFKRFIIDNMNKIPALAIVCQRPRELTRQALKELKMALDEQGYSVPKLRTAWREWKNEDIAADIISFIRRQALGDPLLSHEERIRLAMKKVYALRSWTKIQRQWLERMEKQLIQETIFERADFDKGAFRDYGGFDRINKIFEGNLATVLGEINSALYPDENRYHPPTPSLKTGGGA
jgi:type I restriction enzyme R subunit